MSFVESFEHYAGDLKGLSGGITSCCATCQEQHGYDQHENAEESMAHDLSQGLLPDEGSFSWAQCDTCGSTLGGERYTGHCFAPQSMDVIHLDVCVDCLFFIANGDVPEDDDA